jgi:hypothetical protein
MANEYPRWWLDRWGQAAAATVTTRQREPVYGLVADTSMSALRPGAFEGVVNEIQGYSGSVNLEQNYTAQARQSGPRTLNNISDEIRFQAEQIDWAVQQRELSPAQAEQLKQDAAKTLIEGIVQNREQYNLSEEGADQLVEFFLDDKQDGGGFWGSLSGVDEETGINRTERKWLQAQADQDSDIAWQEDAQLDPDLRRKAEQALETGEWDEDLATAYSEYQGNPFKDKFMEGIDWLDEHVYEPIKENASAAVIALNQWGDHKSEMEGQDWGTIWRNARDSANNVSFGQAFVDSISEDPDEVRRAYSEGFDETGQPLDQAYFDRRQGALYNAGSGLTDFAFTWYADPLVGVGKGLTTARALARADVRAMSPAMRDRFLIIATAPSDELARTRTTLHPHANPLDRRALAVREEMDSVRDRIREGTAQESDLLRYSAFKEDPLAIQFFTEAARFRKSDQFGRLTDEYDDDVFNTAVAAMYGYGPARNAMVEKGEVFRDIMAAYEPKLTAVDDDIRRLRDEFERTAPPTWRPGAREAYEKAWTPRYDLQRSVDEKTLLEAELAEYNNYNQFTNDFLYSPDETAGLRNLRFHEPARMIAQTFRTSAVNQLGATITRYPRAAFKKRSGVADLTRGSETLEAARRYMDDMAKYGHVKTVDDEGFEVDNLTIIARNHGFQHWEQLKDNFFQRILVSKSDTERRRIMADLEDTGVETISTKFGMTSDEALKVSEKVKQKRNQLYAMMIRQKEESSRAAIDPATAPRDVWTHADGEVVENIELPVSVTELENYYVPADLRSLGSLLSNHGEGIKAGMRNPSRTTGEAATEALEAFNGFWKPAVLLRGGYPIRNVTDGQLRALALTGSFMTAANSARGLAIGTINTGSRLLDVFPRLAGHKGRIPKITQVGQKPSSTIRVRGRVHESEFQRGSGDVALVINSADKSMAQMYKSELAGMRDALSHLKRTTAGEKGHAEAWLHVLHNRVTKDPFWRKMLQGEDDDAIVNWLNRSTEGGALKRRAPWKSHDPVKWVDELRVQFDTYVPDDVLRAKLAADEPIDLAYLQGLMDDTGRASPMMIDEAAVEMAQGSGKLAQLWGGFVDRAYHVLGTLPEDNLMRNPFFRTQYRNRLKDTTRKMDGEILSDGQMKALDHDARQFATAQTRRYMFTLADQSDMTHWFRFMSPFIGAQMEAVRRWGRIFFEHPESFSRLYVNGWQDLDDAAWWELVDQNGLGEDDPDHGPLENLRMQVPKSMLKKLDWLVPGDFSAALDVWAPTIEGEEMPTNLTPAQADQWKKAHNGTIGFSIPKRSLNVSLQGDPFFIPGAGPLVQMPTGFLASRYPELADEQSFRGMVYRFLFPTGIPEAHETLLPAAWMQQMLRRFRGMDDPVFANMADNLYKQEFYAWEQGGRQGPRPDPREIIEKTKLTQTYFALGRFGMPVSYQLQPQSQLFIDAARQYMSEMPYEEAYAKFVKDYGDDAFYFWSSNSQTNVGVPATSAGVRANKQFKDLIEEHPDIAVAITGLQAEKDAFNYAAYEQQLNMPISPWDPRKRRERLSPEEAIAKAEQQKGWEEWGIVNETIVAELAARGLDSIRQAGAKDLAELKNQVESHLRQQYPGWADDKDTFDKSRGYKVVDDFRTVLESGGAPIRADWEGIAEYIEIHDTIAAELDARDAAGGSRSIEAASNEDLDILYNRAVLDLQERNLRFADIYSRFLDNHSITNGTN